MAGCKIISCTCSNEYQDTTYGKNKRVANLNLKGKAKCTVCGKVEN